MDILNTVPHGWDVALNLTVQLMSGSNALDSEVENYVDSKHKRLTIIQ